jgi:hypothetical protein
MIVSMRAHGWLEPYPMHVVSRNGRFFIIDGQHRFKAAQSLGLPVLYVVGNDDTRISVSDINVAQSAWNHFDFACSYANQGNPHYIKLLDFSKRHKLPLGISAKLLMMKEAGRSTCTREIREGTFKAVNLQSAEMMADTILRLKRIVVWASNSSFICALIKAVQVRGFDFNVFIQRCESNPGLLVLQPTTDAFLQMIEHIYNYRTRPENKLAIKFEATKTNE